MGILEGNMNLVGTCKYFHTVQYGKMANNRFLLIFVLSDTIMQYWIYTVALTVHDTASYSTCTVYVTQQSITYYCVVLI